MGKDSSGAAGKHSKWMEIRDEDIVLGEDVIYDIRPSEYISVTMGPFGSWICKCENCEAYRQHKTDCHDGTHPGHPETPVWKGTEIKEWKTDRLAVEEE